MNNNEKEIAKNIYTSIYNSGKSTDYFYSPKFNDWVKEKAINEAERTYKGEILNNIIKEINLL